MFAETLYKTKSPATSPVLPEFYEIGFEAIRGEGRVEYRVIEIHGWWDDKEKRLIHRQETLKPDVGEGYPTYEEAQKRYADQKRHRAEGGFVHLFRIEIPSGREIYEEIVID
jgi:hypothetical protein